jgi:hypothetical protein
VLKLPANNSSNDVAIRRHDNRVRVLRLAMVLSRALIESLALYTLVIIFVKVT